MKRHVLETGTGWMRGRTAPGAGHILSVVGMTRVEVVSTLTRQPRSDARDPTAAAMALAQFRHDWAHQSQTVDIAPARLVRAIALAETYARRGYGATQCAAAVLLYTERSALGMPPLTPSTYPSGLFEKNAPFCRSIVSISSGFFWIISIRKNLL